jgi:hypothetical protein
VGSEEVQVCTKECFRRDLEIEAALRVWFIHFQSEKLTKPHLTGKMTRISVWFV